MKNPKESVIGGVPVGPGHPPFVIAEMSGNHNQSLERALAIVDAAAAAGAHAVKLQTYTADSITMNVDSPEFYIRDSDSLWRGQHLYQLYQQACTPRAWHAAIMRRAKDLGLLCFSSPFDESAVDFLAALDVPAFKIASFENNHLPLIRKAAQTGKPLIMSTGMATLAELDEAVAAARESGCRDLILLKCTSTYPANPSNSNLLTIPHMAELFDCLVGVSDHTLGIGASVAAVAQGACVVEKHFTLSRAEGGVDSAFSLEPAELKALVSETKTAWQSLGRVSYGPTEAENKSLRYRRSLYAAKDIKRGEALTAAHIKCIRPANGLAPKHLDLLIGRKAARDLPGGSPITWDLFSQP